MKGVSQWSFRPYKPLLFETGEITICRIAPGQRRIGLDWLPVGGYGGEENPRYTVRWRRRGSPDPFPLIR